MSHFRLYRILVKCSLIGMISLSATQLHGADCTPIAQLISLEGMVEVKKADQDSWQTARLNESYCAGDIVRTQQSRAALRLTNATMLRLNANSTLILSNIQESAPSLLDLIRGAVHSISRTPKRMDINTPYVNASIEGTEFVVSIENQATNVTVLEGTVVTRNKQGSLTLTADQASKTGIGQAPVSVTVTQPYKAVAWALYYPPLPDQPGVADALAKSAIEALVQNRLREAAELAEQAISADTHSSAAYMAHSYVNQARFDIPAALQDSLMAVKRTPHDALVQARLAEVHLMSGNHREARKVAEQAVTLQPSLPLAHTVLGFTSLRDIELNQAGKSFEAALELDSEAPLPRLGLGLVNIRKGDLTLGREAIETAVLLDPSNALLRSYLGKAYYEEKRNTLAYQQFAMAKQLDPNDPTAWFYESILLQSDNRPIEALQAQQQAIVRNDNRGVYRSRQLLDQDEAARHAALGRIYSDLNFEQQSRLQAANALTQDPGNHSAHRLMADSYLGITNRDSARQSELLQANMSQLLNLDPLQPQLNNANLGLLDGAGPEDLAYQEYNPLFTRNGMALQLDAALGEHKTWSNDAIVAGLSNQFAFSLGQYHSETDLSDNPYDYKQDMLSGFLQVAVTEGTLLQLEVSQQEEDKGDASQRLMPEFLNLNNVQIKNELSTARIGLNQSISSRVTLLLSAIRRDQDFTSIDSSSPSPIVRTDTEKQITLYETQILGGTSGLQWLGGISHQSQDLESTLNFNFSEPPGCPFPSCNFDSETDLSQSRLYGYTYYNAIPMFSITGGIALLSEENEFDDDLKKAYPKLGLQITPDHSNTIRMAAFRNRVSVVLPSLYETLEPTQITGFNQMYDDIDQTDSWNYGLAYNYQYSNDLHIGAASVYRDLSTKINIVDTSSPFMESSIQQLEYSDRYTNLWLNWTPSSQWAVSLEYEYNRYNLESGIKSASDNVLAPDGVLQLTTHRAPASLNYFHPSGFITTLKTTYIDQSGTFIDSYGVDSQDGEDSGVVTDIALSYRLPKRLGSVSFGVNNIFDEDLRFEDRSSYDTDDPISSASPTSFAGERTIYGKLSLTFR